MALRDVHEVVADHDGHARTVLEYTLAMERIVAQAKDPDFSGEAFAPLADLVAVDDFERVGNFKDLMDWDEYVGFLMRWAPQASWAASFKRVTEQGNLVFLELEERSTAGGVTRAANSLSVYEMDADGKIRHIDVYLQLPVPAEALPPHYQGIRTAE